MMLFIFLVLASMIFTCEASEIENLKERVAILEQKSIETPNSAYAKTNTGFFLTGEPLLWKITEEGLEYAITGSYTTIPLPIQPPVFEMGHARAHRPRFEWNWGTRLGAGYKTSYDDWDLFSTWSRFQQQLDDYVNAKGDPTPLSGVAPGSSGQVGNYVSPFWIAQIFSIPGYLNEGKAIWKLHLNIIDLELGKKFLISKHLSFRPFIGLRNGWIHQKYDLAFSGFYFPIDPTVLDHTIEVEMKNHFWGLGGRAGLNTQWLFGKGLSIYGNFAFSILQGHFNVRYKLKDLRQFLTIRSAVLGGNSLNLILPPYDGAFEDQNHIHTAVCTVDSTLGLRWDCSFLNERYDFGIWAGYEQSIFFSQNQFMNHQYDFTLNTLGGSPPGGGGGPNFFTERSNLVACGFSGGVQLGF